MDPGHRGQCRQPTPGRDLARGGSQGGVHLRYLAAGGLRYAYRAAGGSFTTTQVAPLAVAPGSAAHSGNTLALDPLGGVHLAHHPSWSEVGYAHLPKGGSWSTQVVDSASSSNFPPSLALDVKGGVHLGYLGTTARSVRRAHKPAGGVFTTQQVIGSVVQLLAPSLAVDEKLDIHLSYQHDFSNGSLRYLHIPAGGSAFDFFNIIDSGVENPRLAVDRLGGVHVTYGTWSSLHEAYKPSGGTFASSWIENAVSSESSLAIDSTGGLHLAYYDDASTARVLKYARKSGAFWVTSIADSQAKAGMQPALRIDDLLGLHVVYWDWNNKNLKYAYRCP